MNVIWKCRYVYVCLLRYAFSLKRSLTSLDGHQEGLYSSCRGTQHSKDMLHSSDFQQVLLAQGFQTQFISPYTSDCKHNVSSKRWAA
jgi:hypothetical protein